MKTAKAVRGNTPRQLSHTEKNEIKLWFGWGNILNYPTGPKDYLRESLRSHRETFLAMPRDLRKQILRFVIDENIRRAV